MATHPGLIDPAHVRDHTIGPAHAAVTVSFGVQQLEPAIEAAL